MPAYIVLGREEVMVRHQAPIEAASTPDPDPKPKLSYVPCGADHVEGAPCMWCHGTKWLLEVNHAEPAKVRYDPNEDF